MSPIRLRPTRLRAVAVVLGLVLLSAGPVSGQDRYVVRSGDTLSQIAQRHGVTTSALAAANDLLDPNRIRVGQSLTIPGTSGSSSSSSTSSGGSTGSGGTYTVRSGDTLSEIAVRTGTSTRRLMDLNGITDANRIRVGQVLRLDGSTSGGSSTSATTSASDATLDQLRARYPDLPARIRDNPARLALVPHFEFWAAANGLQADLVMAIAWHESGWNQAARSSAGAVGIGQIMPATGEWIARDLIGRPELDAENPIDNIRMTARFVRWLNGYLGDERLAVGGYYQGPGAVRAGIWYDDTESYVNRVAAERFRFRAR